MTRLGIIDIREIVRIIKENHNFDLSNFALTSLKYRLENVFTKNNLRSVELFLKKINNEPQFLDIFIGQLLVPSTEMFRDPSVWRWLRDNILLNLSSTELINLKIWFPYCVSANELYTMMIILKECGIHENARVYCSYFSDYNLEQIKSGRFPLKKYEVSTENYKRFQGAKDFSAYTTIEDGYALRDTSLISNVEFIKNDLSFNNAPRNVKIVICRNAMIYFTPTMQSKMLEINYKSLLATGFLLIGINERLKQNSTDKYQFDAVNKGESIYRRKMNK